MYLFRIGIASAFSTNSHYLKETETNANYRAAENGLPISSWRRQNSSSYKWYEFGFAPVLWPFMWIWNQ
jgi:hypothetical protein